MNKFFIFLSTVLAAGTVMAADQPKEPAKPAQPSAPKQTQPEATKPSENNVRTTTLVPHPYENKIVLESTKPQAPTAMNGRLSGVAVQVVKTRNPLQLINPFAPPEYGSGQQNVASGLKGGNGNSLKLISLKY